MYYVLLFTAFIGHVVSGCDIVGKDHCGIVYMHYTTIGALYPSSGPPNIDDITKQHPGIPYCGSDDGSKYIFASIDNALTTFENFEKNDSSSLLIALIGNCSNASFPMRYSHVVANLKSFILQGFVENVEAAVMCDENVSLSFSHTCDITIQSTSFSRCGTVYTGGVMITNSQMINITTVSVSDSTNSGIQVTLNSLSSACNAYGGSPMYTISNSVFSRNGLTGLNGTQQHPEYGGGMNIQIVGGGFKNTVNVIESKFDGNTAIIGGGFAYSTDDCESELYVAGCEFVSNYGAVHGGAAYLSGANIHFENSKFTSNHATYTAGAIYHFIPIQSGTMVTSIEVEYDNCTFDKNLAEGSGCLLFSTSITSSPEVTVREAVTISNSVFHDNEANRISFFGETSCIIHSSDIPLSLVNAIFEKNMATVVCIESAMINFYGIVKFVGNDGYLGGAIYTKRSLLAIYRNASVSFYNNRAINGGAIYQNGVLVNTSKCLFDFVESENANITFSNNQAGSSGNAIYIYEPNSICSSDVKRPEVYFASSSSSVTSNAQSLKFHEPVVASAEDGHSIDVILGQYIVFNVTIKDYFNQESFAQVNVFIQPPYQIRGFRHFSLESGVNSPKISITGPEVLQEIDAQYKLSIFSVEMVHEINVTLKPCPVGFAYSGTTGQCECFHSDYLACDFTTAAACIRKGFWIGNMISGDNSGDLVVASCASLYCQNINGNCTLCPITDKESFCLLPHSSSEQCLSNRKGLVCTECIHGYAFTFGAIKCVHNDSCKNGMSAIPIILNIAFLGFTVFFLIVVLKLNYRLSSGYLFCFIYYFSIVRHLLNSVVVGDVVLLIVSILTSFTQLNPQFLGYIPICFLVNLSVLQQQVFLYLNPVVISILVLMVIGISRCFSKFIKFGDNTLVKAMCLLMLLSFTALTETSFNILNPVQFNDSNEFYVNTDPTIRYFELTKHLPWFIVAMVIILFLVLPFTFMLLFAPLLTRCFNLTRIKPFLDEFQGCYKDHFRWIAGYYFLARFVYLIVLTAPRYFPVTTQYIIQILSFGVLVVHMLLQPYVNSWLNFADSVLLADLMLMTLLFGSTAGIVFQNVPKLRVALVSILLAIPIVYVIVVVTIGSRWFKSDSKLMKRIFKSGSTEDKEEHFSHTSVERGRSLSYSIGLREPLLDGLSSSISPTSTSRHKKRLVSYSVLESPRDDNIANNEGGRLPSLTSSQIWQDENEGDDLL